jgi:hypothetical protein
MADYLRISSQFFTETNSPLGITITDDTLLQEFMISRIIGNYMGDNPRKGKTYFWIPNHLKDAVGKIYPRSFLKLFSFAATRRLGEFNSKNLPKDTLLTPSDLQGALEETSNDRIIELLDEYPWLEPLKNSLNGLKVPVAKEVFLEKIENTRWREEREKQPPVSHPEEIIQYLLKLGIIEIRSDQRVNMPEIYMYGFGVKRPGGVKRPKRT